MTKLIKTLSLILLFMVIIENGIAQPKKKDRPISLDCVVCHAGWQDDIDPQKSLLPKIEAPIQIEGLPAHVPITAMCITCHDGTVKDSRQVFSSNNHQLGMDIEKVRVKDLPLDKHGDIYCGTCHTPHSLKPERKGGLAPFLRTEVSSSSLCLQCHEEQSKTHVNHPIHVAVNADHKMPEETFFGKGNTLECMTCHPIHGSQATFGVKGDNRRELCSACHENYFNIEFTDHDLTTALKLKSGLVGPSFGEQDACAACHSSHGGKGKNMWAMDLQQKSDPNAYCLDCHSEEGLGREKITTHLGHPVSKKRIKKDTPALGIKAGDIILCTSCHDPHQWEFSQRHAVSEANEEGTEYTSFLRLPDDAQGQLCISCHEDQSIITDSDHSVAREGFQQHFRSIEAFRGQCSACHETHGEIGYQIDEVGTTSDISRELCESCHSEAHSPTTVGGFAHPMGAGLKVSGGLPGFEGELTCITCHDPHKWGHVRENSLTADLDGNDANSFLRVKNWPEPQLCLSCHEEQIVVMKTDHDLSDADHSACSFCHTAHNSKTDYGLLSVWDESTGETSNEKFCFSCHQEKGSAPEKVPQAWKHPGEYGTIPHNVRGTGEWNDFPLFDRDKPSETFGFVDCFTCHDPHKWSFKEGVANSHLENGEGDYTSSFLRNPSHKTLCTDCHGANTLWKYNYFHDPVKRKRY